MKNIIKRNVALLIAIFVLAATSKCVEAKELNDYVVNTKTIVADQIGIDTSEIKRVTVVDDKMEELETLATVIDENGKKIPVDVELKKVDVEEKIEGHFFAKDKTTYYVLTASNAKTSRNSDNYLTGYITWIDNNGPNNKLVSVGGGSANNVKITQYSYGKFFWGSQLTYITVNNTYFNNCNVNLKGLQFILTIYGSNDDTLQIYTSVFD